MSATSALATFIAQRGLVRADDGNGRTPPLAVLVAAGRASAGVQAGLHGFRLGG